MDSKFLKEAEFVGDSARSNVESSVTPVPHLLPITPGPYSNSLAIRQEIQRFESVHPSIYAIYDLLELIGGADGHLISQRIREHVVCIEDSFVNSQEWTLSRSVPDLRLGVVGSVISGKSALVHRYLTGSYLQDESPEGGRFKKEVIVDGQSYLLLIRDEGGSPEVQFSCWVDAVIFVFSLDNESSFNEVHGYYTKLFQLRSTHDIPIFLVGTQDSVSEANPRVIEESRARKLAMEMKRCTYYETCATYGLNVEKVFQDACHKIVQLRNLENSHSRPSTPSQSLGSSFVFRNLTSTTQLSSVARASPTPAPFNNITNNKLQHLPSNSGVYVANTKYMPDSRMDSCKQVPSQSITNAVTKPAIATKPKLSQQHSASPLPASKSVTPVTPKRHESLKMSNDSQFKVPLSVSEKEKLSVKDSKDQVTPVQTPNTNRKNRRKSNLFTPLTSKNKSSDDKFKNGEVGSGRTIPIKQGYLYKKSKKTLNKDWKKKYVTLTTDGCLTYHPTLHDYMDDVHGKNIPLKHTTVKIPGQKPRCGRTSMAHSPNNLDTELATHDRRRIPITNPKYESSNSKKRSRKVKSGHAKNGELGDESDGNEFVIVSLDNKQWHFNAINTEEREEWISAIEQQIFSSLQNSEYDKSKLHNVTSVDESIIHSIRTVPGNKYCVDCDAPNPDWASLNMGALICIECSGIHRNLGTHISKVRSLYLDVWPTSHVSVMLGLGNTATNKILEQNLNGKIKPSPTSSHEEKERFIRAKYERKEFLAPLNNSSTPIEQQIVDSVLKMDLKLLAHLLTHASRNNISLTFSQVQDKRTPLHLAATRGCLEIAQLLLWNNVDEKALDSEGKTAIFYARIHGHKEIEELLMQSGCSEATTDTLVESSLSLNDSQRKQAKRRESIPLNFKSIEIFNKLPASII